ncbi:MAG: helix-turn-helix domain-containing protein, partial [Candidatus Levyibacteriota bacterium]
RHSVQLIGMKRVGINGFLRYFLFNKAAKKTYIANPDKHFFILVDLFDLIERELFPFWRLFFKRIADAVEISNLPNEVKEKISHLFLESIQSGDLFLTFDGVKESFALISNAGVLPTVFLTRFDRLQDVITPQFLDNLQSLREATGDTLSYVFTSFRDSESFSDVFEKNAYEIFANKIYLKPAGRKDTEIIFDALITNYHLSVQEDIKHKILSLSGGHLQYLQLSVVILQELLKKQKEIAPADLEKNIKDDERIALQSEELWETLMQDEKDLVQKVKQGKKLSLPEKDTDTYIFRSGFLIAENNEIHFFSPLFELFMQELQESSESLTENEFSKKEHMLFSLLQSHLGHICEREKIIETAWPEYKEYGASDWSVDRLVARVRGKLKKQQSMLEIITVRTRGYKLVNKK